MMSPVYFQRKICVITGGALGIGRCLTRSFAAAGCKIAFIDINNEAGLENQAWLLSNQFDAFFYQGDLANSDTLNSFHQAVLSRFGAVDFLINNACISHQGILSGCSYDDFNQVLKIGVSAPYELCRLFLPDFRSGAAVVNISSTRAFMSQADTESYSAAKGAITALTHALAVSLAGKVRVNAIAPGWIDTGSCYQDNYTPDYELADEIQHPAGRVGIPEDIASAALFLCHEDNHFITGTTLTIDGGMTRKMIYHHDEGWQLHPE